MYNDSITIEFVPFSVEYCNDKQREYPLPPQADQGPVFLQMYP